MKKGGVRHSFWPDNILLTVFERVRTNRHVSDKYTTIKSCSGKSSAMCPTNGSDFTAWFLVAISHWDLQIKNEPFDSISKELIGKKTLSKSAVIFKNKIKGCASADAHGLVFWTSDACITCRLDLRDWYGTGSTRARPSYISGSRTSRSSFVDFLARFST